VPADGIDVVRGLGTVGFYPVDVNITLARSPGTAENVAAVFDVEQARSEYEDAVLAIAGSVFRYSRFHLDPLLPRELADRVKRDWIESYFRGRRGDHLLVALDDGGPVGFLAVLDGERDGRRVRTIDLVGVSVDHQARGVGRALTQRFLADADGVSDVVEVGTQAANVAATKMYERMGFGVARTAFVLHKHVGGG
jgi:GNAT superfamily N-acetyltransferase